MITAPPSLRATLHRVEDVQRAGAGFQELLGCPIGPGPRPGWLALDVGMGQSLYLAPGGHPLTPIQDRWEQRGIIPILKTMAVDDEAAALDARGAGWVNRPFDYQMKGGGRLGYVLGPENHPIGLQQRMSDTVREEDLATQQWLERQDQPPRWLGIGWLIYQAADIVGVRDFIEQAFGWRQLRGTDGFGYMLQIDALTMLQIAFKGVIQDPRRDLSAEAVLPVLRCEDVPALQTAVRQQGGSAPAGVDGFAAVADPEGRVWLLEAAAP